MDTNQHWFHKKWGLNENRLENRIIELEKMILELQQKYDAILIDVQRLEEESIESTNTLYEIMNSVDAVDSRIDILTLEKWTDKNV